MSKSLSLFGRYIRHKGKHAQWTFRKYQVTKMIPNNAAGRTPSAASQTGLFHNDDFNAFWRVSAFNTIFRKRTKPHVTKKDFESDNLNSVVRNMRVTPSAMYAMDDKGGFDQYLMRTPPEEIRSNTGEKLRSLMYYYMDNPVVKKWALPYRALMRKRDRLDPHYARYMYSLKQTQRHRSAARSHSQFSPFYLPKSDDGLYPQRDRFPESTAAPRLDLWWKSSPEVESSLRLRLTQAKSFEEAHPDHRIEGAFRKGEGAGGGGKSSGNPRPRSKTYRNRQIRSY
jgi:large subunit ribosomal protein L28